LSPEASLTLTLKKRSRRPPGRFLNLDRLIRKITVEAIQSIQQTEVLARLGWQAAAQEMLEWQWELAEEAALYGQQLADAVVTGELTAAELRGGVAWADMHVAEVEGREEGDLTEAEKLEVAARRLAQRAGHWALDQVQTLGDLAEYREGYQRRQRLLRSEAAVRLGRLEAKDLSFGASHVRIK
jgi:hypothetical protein